MKATNKTESDIFNKDTVPDSLFLFFFYFFYIYMYNRRVLHR